MLSLYLGEESILNIREELHPGAKTKMSKPGCNPPGVRDQFWGGVTTNP